MIISIAFIVCRILIPILSVIVQVCVHLPCIAVLTKPKPFPAFISQLNVTGQPRIKQFCIRHGILIHGLCVLLRTHRSLNSFIPFWCHVLHSTNRHTCYDFAYIRFRVFYHRLRSRTHRSLPDIRSHSTSHERRRHLEICTFHRRTATHRTSRFCAAAIGRRT